MKTTRLLALIASTMILTTPAMALQDFDPFADETPMSMAELQDARGGFLVNGYEIDFGATITLFDGTIHSFSNDAESFILALRSLGLNDRADRLAGLATFNSDDFTTVFSNSLNDQTFTQSIEIDVVIHNFEIPLTIGNVMTFDASTIGFLTLPSFQ